MAQMNEKPTLLRAAVLGHPIAHSKSPVLHGFWLRQLGIKGAYEAIDTPPQQLAERLQALATQGYAGVNLTVPLKEAVLPLLQQTEPLAHTIGAVNAVLFTAKGMQGYNSDAYGFTANLQHAPVLAESGLEPHLQQVRVLGAGGAARAVVAGVLQAGAKALVICNRSRDKAEQLAADFAAAFPVPVTVADWQDRHRTLQDATLLVNTTALGMQGKPPLELSLKSLPQTALVTDIVYQPLMTDLLLAAQARGNPVIDGLGMLLYQAQPAFEYFFGVRPKVDADLRKAVLQ